MAIRALLAAFTLFLCGCATRYHEPPADAPSALVTFSNVGAPGMVEFWAHSDNETCGGALFIPEAFSVHRGEHVTVRFPTAQELTLSANWGTSTEYCRIFVTFRPVADEQYLAWYGHEGEKCGFVVLQDRRPQGGTLIPAPGFRQRNANPWMLADNCPRETR